MPVASDGVPNALSADKNGWHVIVTLSDQDIEGRHWNPGKEGNPYMKNFIPFIGIKLHHF